VPRLKSSKLQIMNALESARMAVSGGFEGGVGYLTKLVNASAGVYGIATGFLTIWFVLATISYSMWAWQTRNSSEQDAADGKGLTDSGMLGLKRFVDATLLPVTIAGGLTLVATSGGLAAGAGTV
jgi:hypothetical protein